MKIIVDGFGGDNAPEAIVEGVVANIGHAIRNNDFR